MSTINFYMTASDTQTAAAAGAAALNENSRSVFTHSTNSAAANDSAAMNNSITKNKAKQSKKYYCAYANHGHNNSHDTMDCDLRKTIGHNPTHPDHPGQKAFRQALDRVARKQLGVGKVDPSRQQKHKKKGFLEALAGYTHEQLKAKMEEMERMLEEMRKEMKHRGVR